MKLNRTFDLDGFVEQKDNLNPWLQIWFAPRETIRRIASATSIWQFLLLSLIAGLPIYTDFLAQRGGVQGPFFSPSFLVLSLVTGSLFITFHSLILFWIGKLFNGKASYPEMRSTLAWALLPAIIPFIFKVAIFFFYGERCFDSTLSPVHADDSFTVLTLLFYSILYFVFLTWSFITLLIGVAEVQQFSLWKSFFNIFLPNLILPILVFLLLLLFPLGFQYNFINIK